MTAKFGETRSKVNSKGEQFCPTVNFSLECFELVVFSGKAWQIPNREEHKYLSFILYMIKIKVDLSIKQCSNRSSDFS
jgi:hypothetical protein